MTVEELKAAAANLPSDDRLEFADWLAQDQGVQHARNDRLRRALQHVWIKSTGANALSAGTTQKSMRCSARSNGGPWSVSARRGKRLASDCPHYCQCGE
jgi:hypothetical protein